MVEHPELKSPVGRAVDRLDGAALFAGSLGIVAFTSIVVYVVAVRYLFGQTPFWAEELPRLLLVWVTFIGAIAAFARGTHFEAGLMPLIIKNERVRSGAKIVAALASAVFLVILAKTGFDITKHTWGNMTTALRWPVGLTYLALPVCCSLSALAVIGRLIARD